MPRISYFYGIAIWMDHDDHPPAHFHAHYAEHRAEYDITQSTRIVGSIPHRAEALVLEWIALHQAELLENWDRARKHQPLKKIDPLP